MSNRGRAKSDTKNRQILDAAIRLFVGNGYHNTSMDQIAASAGVSKQTVYSHFTNKQELFKSAVQSRRSEFLGAELALDTQAPPRATLRRFATALLRLLLSEDVVRTRRVCDAEAESHPEVAAAYFSEGPEHTTRLLSEYLTQLHHSGKLRISNPHHAAIQLLYMLTGEAQMRALLNQPAWTEEQVTAYLDSSIAMFLRAYATDQCRCTGAPGDD
jgi:AcrR family transcriptional regulator